MELSPGQNICPRGDQQDSWARQTHATSQGLLEPRQSRGTPGVVHR